jgi:hypothetical protein
MWPAWNLPVVRFEAEFIGAVGFRTESLRRRDCHHLCCPADSAGNVGEGTSVMAAQAFLYAMAPIAYPTSIRGVGVGTAVAAGRIGSIVGPKLGGYLKSAGHGPAQLLMDLLPLVLNRGVCPPAGLLLNRAYGALQFFTWAAKTINSRRAECSSCSSPTR